MKQMVIRLAHVTEHAAVAECVNAAYAKYIERIGKKPAPMLADYTSLIARGHVYVLEDALGEVQGVLVLETQDDGLFIENVAVDPASQGRGMGRALMNFAAQLGLFNPDPFFPDANCKQMRTRTYMGTLYTHTLPPDGNMVFLLRVLLYILRRV